MAPADLIVRPAAAQAVAIDNDDIGGVVTGPKGPEAGVWVIAETTDLPTNFIKMVVTDDQGRYVIPDLPTANYQVWVRGYGLVDSPKLRAKPGQTLNHTAVPAPNDAAAAHYYPAIYWYSMLTNSAGERVRRQRRYSEECHAHHVDRPDEERRLRRLPSARSRGDAHDPGAVRQVRHPRRRLGPARAVGAVRRADDRTPRRPAWQRAVPIFRRLDATHRQRRAAVRQAAAAAGRRAQHRGHVVGVVDARQVHARSDLVGPAQSDGQRQRQALRLAGVLDRHDADPRSQDAHGDRLQDAGAGSEHAAVARSRACRERRARRAVALLGRPAALGHPRQQPQRHVRRARPRVECRDHPRPAQSGLLQEGSIRRPNCSRST